VIGPELDMLTNLEGRDWSRAWHAHQFGDQGHAASSKERQTPFCCRDCLLGVRIHIFCLIGSQRQANILTITWFVINVWLFLLFILPKFWQFLCPHFACHLARQDLACNQ
jgi:hypothetical protein